MSITWGKNEPCAYCGGEHYEWDCPKAPTVEEACFEAILENWHGRISEHETIWQFEDECAKLCPDCGHMIMKHMDVEGCREERADDMSGRCGCRKFMKDFEQACNSPSETAMDYLRRTEPEIFIPIKEDVN
jgi:hypothetical protein